MSPGEINKKRLLETDKMISTEGFENSSARWVKEKSVLIALAEQGKTRGGLNTQIIADLMVRTPKIKEQEKIGLFLKKIDDTIALHQRKVELLQKMKQGILQKMFPQNEKKIPCLRFANFEGEWEQCKLGEVLYLLKDGTHGTHGTHTDVSEGIYLLSAKNIKNGEIIIDDLSDRRISEGEYSSIHKNFALKQGDVLLTIVGSIGETAIIRNHNKITFQRSFAYLRPNKELQSQFLFTTINSYKFQSELKKRQVVSAQPGIYLGDLSVIPIQLPSLGEQQKIGSFFKQLDNTITLHQNKLEELKSLKKTFLQKMFV